MFTGPNKWQHISTKDSFVWDFSSYQFLLSSYPVYWTKGISIRCSRDNVATAAEYYAPWAVDVMTPTRFRQLSSDFHSENITSDIDSKCYQMRRYIDKLTHHAIRAFVPGLSLRLDKNGIAI